MPKIQFANNEIYHVYNRGVDKRKIFMDDVDYLRFIHDLFEFNDTNLVNPSNIRLSSRNPSSVSANQLDQCLAVEPPNIKIKRKLLIEILVFCLMPNHYHLMIRQLVDGGVSKFLQKLGTGYTQYFNNKYERSGVLFQGRSKAILLKSEAHFFHLPYYIHTNPLDLIMPKWKEEKTFNYEKAMTYLDGYRWSSFRDYIGKKNFSSVTQRELLLDTIGNSKQHEANMLKWLRATDIQKLKQEDVKNVYID